MRKVILVTFGVDPTVDENQKGSVLEAAQNTLGSRTWKSERQGDTVVVKHLLEDWSVLDETKTCPENVLWNLSLEGMIFQTFTVKYDPALLPSPQVHSSGDHEFRKGECHCFIEIHDRVVVTSLPNWEEVSISLDLTSPHSDMDTLRKGFLGIVRRFEAQLRLTQTLRRLIQAYQFGPRNGGRIKRFTNQLFLEIAKV